MDKGAKQDILSRMYDACCEKYRRRLCAQWEISFGSSFWISDIIGDELSVGDYRVLDMPEVKYCVDNGVAYEAFDEYWNFVMDEAHKGYNHPRINFNSWFRLGARPDILKD